jgi:hypothetical protein
MLIHTPTHPILKNCVLFYVFYEYDPNFISNKTQVRAVSSFCRNQCLSGVMYKVTIF